MLLVFERGEMVFSVTKNLEINKCRKSENIWFQWQCTIIEILPLLTFGLQIGWIARSNTTLVVPPDLKLWVDTILYLAAAFSTGILCYLNEKFGRKKIIFFVSIVQIISWLLLLLDDNITCLITSRVFIGIGAGGVFTIIPIYLFEISNKSFRGLTVTFGILTYGFGFFLMHILMQYLRSESILYGVIILPLIHMFMSFFTLESPSFLVKINNFEKATNNISKLRGLNIDDERVTKETDRLKREREDTKITEGYYFISLLKNQVNRNGLKIGLVLLTVRTLGGSYVITDQSWKVYMRSDVPLHDDVQKLAVPGILIVAALISVLLVDTCGRKPLLITSTCVTVLSLGVLGVFMQTDLTVTSLNWLPLTALIFTTMGYGLGFFTVPFVIINEVLNLEVRSAIIGITFTYTWLLMFIQKYTFSNIEEYIGLDAITYIYAAINIYGAVYTLFGIPETTNKSFCYVERELRRTPLLKFDV